MKLPDIKDEDDANVFQTCMHEAGHVLLVLLSQELTLKDPAITHPQNSQHVARTELTAVHQHQKSAQKSRELVRIAVAGRHAEEKLDAETAGCEWWMPAVPIHWKDDMDSADQYVAAGSLEREYEGLWDDSKALVVQYWDFVCALAAELYLTAPSPLTRQTVLELAAWHQVLPEASHP